jgi:hypothetical protein
MPTANITGRLMPAPVVMDNGEVLLFSSTTDQACAEVPNWHTNRFVGSEVVLTVLDPTLFKDQFESGNTSAWDATFNG